ncbi:putative nucleotide-diphospho-sugar transferase [Tropicimonas sp. IMCC34043]|uniref:putative nucleotide-diphospho-sugar transferase n=1 Tax=Tropicimonas sp. IMCC34043 TaxID=2248760 RepID=UPI000E25FF8E|nr:putative nucleotide-diphospho-sugar transferase [Tropicimonas sp. IMCC34043]
MTDLDDSCGFVFGVSGEAYVPLAVNAARSLKAVCPDARIDLFTDLDPKADGLFEQIHMLERSWFRPKFEALLRSRFSRTIYLDADMIVVADPGDIFEVLERFDIAVVHNQHRNSVHAQTIWKRPLPNAFPQMNGGLIGIRKSPAVTRLVEDLQQAMLDDPDLKVDQAPMRELLFDSDLRLAILPPEYNLMQVRMTEVQSRKDTAPRILHLTRLHAHAKGRERPLTRADQAMGPVLWWNIQRMLKNDRTLGGAPDRRFRPLVDRGVTGALQRAWRKSLKWIWQSFG